MSASPKDNRKLLSDGQTEAPANMPAAFAAGLQIADASGQIFVPRKRWNTQHVLIVTTLALSAALIYGMRRYGMQSGLKFETVDVAYKRDDNTHRRAADFQKIMAQLEAADVASSEGVRHNPFRLMGPEAGDPNSAAATDNTAELARQKKESRLAALKDELATLKLGSIMKGRIPLARINDVLVRVNDPVGDSFIVEKIDPMSVTLRADDDVFVLELASDEPNSPNATPRPRETRRPASNQR